MQQNEPAVEPETFLEALPFVLQRCQLKPTAQQLLLCRLLCVSRSCRAAVQQSGMQCSIQYSPGSATVAALASLGAWLGSHAGLVGELDMSTTGKLSQTEGGGDVTFQLPGSMVSTRVLTVKTIDELVQAARSEHHVATGLQAYSSATSAASQPGTALPPLRLSALCWRSLRSSAVLLAISPPQHLTKLSLTHLEPRALTPAMLAGVQRFSGLQELRIGCRYSHYERKPLNNTVWDCVGALSRLTSLQLEGVAAEAGVFAKLPAGLRDLTLMLFEHDQELVYGGSLEHLSCLTNVTLNKWDAYGLRSIALPQTLSVANLLGYVDVALPPTLHSLGLSDPEVVSERLEALPQLHQLRKLSLFVDDSEQAEHLKVEEELNVHISDAERVCKVLRTLTQLTCLHLDMQGWHHAICGCAECVKVGAALACLMGLQELACLNGWLDESDAVKLSCLTKLTCLSMAGCRLGVSDMAAVALACSLTGLVSLDISDCGLTSQAVLPAAARLTKLTQLKLHGNHVNSPCCLSSEQELVVDKAGLFMLTSLRVLQELSISANHRVSQAALLRFVDVMPHLDCVNVIKCSQLQRTDFQLGRRDSDSD